VKTVEQTEQINISTDIPGRELKRLNRELKGKIPE
jgi:hypothetical protein